MDIKRLKELADVDQVSENENEGSFQNVVRALGDALENAPHDSQERLAQAIEDYAAKYKGSFDRMLKSHNALYEIFAEVIEAVDARPEY